MNKLNDYDISQGSITSPQGYKACGIHCGIKRKRKDLALIVSDKPAMVAGLFTTNRFAAAPVQVSKRVIKQGSAQAIIINSGNANACTGQQGILDAEEMIFLTGKSLGISSRKVLLASTGVIGVPLPMPVIRSGIKNAVELLSRHGGIDAAHAIMTTDTRPKHFSVHFKIGGNSCCIGGIAKGSGMINPHLATMIVIMTTDVNIRHELLQEAIKTVASETFNALTIDGEMSTNDAVLLMANGMSGNKVITTKGKDYLAFTAGLKIISHAITRELALDGEGATKLIIVTVDHARSEKDAFLVAKSIANSLLVKTAIFGNDPNWGRVISSIGATKSYINPQKVSIKFAGVQVVSHGEFVEFDKATLQKSLMQKEIHIQVDLGVGRSKAVVYSCDLTPEYIKINASYCT